jgi:hypothetical protein
MSRSPSIDSARSSIAARVETNKTGYRSLLCWALELGVPAFAIDGLRRLRCRARPLPRAGRRPRLGMRAIPSPGTPTRQERFDRCGVGGATAAERRWALPSSRWRSGGTTYATLVSRDLPAGGPGKRPPHACAAGASAACLSEPGRSAKRCQARLVRATCQGKTCRDGGHVLRAASRGHEASAVGSWSTRSWAWRSASVCRGSRALPASPSRRQAPR